MGILNACQPRGDILAGSFNPEIFTAQLSDVLRHYRGEPAAIDSIYTDAEAFFGQATFPTAGLKQVLSEVFGRLAGDNARPAIHRLETAFGGGKTHALIACTHIAKRGTELKTVTREIVPPELLPAPGTIEVVGIAGDALPVHRPQGTRLVPYTLWGEIAYQLGGEALYKSVREEAESPASPGEDFLSRVFEGRKALLMLDELAQYAARLGAAHPDGAGQLAAFLMALLGYAQTHAGIAVVMTLASAQDAFANQTQALQHVLGNVLGRDVASDEALSIGEAAIRRVSSVTARHASAVVPVHAAEISRVLAVRLFEAVDSGAARQTAREYMELYEKNRELLPQEASNADFADRMMAHYPFHPTLLDFLNAKLATNEDFQGTRGVLRVLAFALRSIWHRKQDVPMIHTSHLDLRDERTVNELINRTRSSNLLPILNADIGGVDTGMLEGGRSNAELADRSNPHPEGWPYHEYTWKTVFLHSLVGRDQGLKSNLFGIAEQDALFSVAFPGLTPSQVREALKRIGETAFYLRSRDGRYFASLDPSINVALAKIRRSLGTEAVDTELDTRARKTVASDHQPFKIAPDVFGPEDIPDQGGRPVLALVSLHADGLSVMDCITTAGESRPRFDQNHVFVLAPETARVRVEHAAANELFVDHNSPAEKKRQYLRDSARHVLAMRRLKNNPQDYGISPRKLEEDEFAQRFSRADHDLEVAVRESYRYLYFPTGTGTPVRKDIRSGGGEGGATVVQQILQALRDEGELVTAEHDTQSYLKELVNLFFRDRDTVDIAQLRQNFARLRGWPVLEHRTVLAPLIRAGVRRGLWCLFRFDDPDAARPSEFFSRETDEPPLTLDLDTEGYALITPAGANQRSWAPDKPVPPEQVEDWLRDALRTKNAATVADLHADVVAKHGELPLRAFQDAAVRVVQRSKSALYRGRPEQQDKPDELYADYAVTPVTPRAEDVLITRSEAARRGWESIGEGGERNEVYLHDPSNLPKVLALLRKLASLYERGGKSTIDTIELTDWTVPGDAKLHLTLENVTPESAKTLTELFEQLDHLATRGTVGQATLEIRDPEEDCPVVRELRKE